LRSRQTRRILPPLAEWIPTVSPGYSRPYHLAPILDRMTAFREKPFRFVAAAPPRHSKTESAAVHFIPWVLKQWPELLITYVTYSGTLAQEKSVQAREIAARIGVPIGSLNRQDVWKTPQGGGCRAVGVGGSLTGRGSHLIIVDDPIPNAVEAESAYQREQLWNWWQSTLFNRREPNASVVVFHTRWHEDDLAGRLIAKGWEYVNLPAINEEGEALWPERWTLPMLEDIREQVGDYYWPAQYLGQPKARGAKVFKDAWFCDSLPKKFRAAIGVDLAYSEKRLADWSVSVVMLKSDDGLFYVADVKRERVEAPLFKVSVRAQRSRYPGAPLRWYCSGTEKGVADFFKAKPDPVPLEAVPATADKFARAQPFAAAWNRGDILLPRDAPWVDDFLKELGAFTGVRDKHDDQIDSAAAAFDLLNDARSQPVRLPPPSEATGRRL
jgi:predicted phage terminase large subunit-like protein